MTDYEQELRNKWNNISYHDGGSLQLAINHPLEWNVRYVAREQKSIVIVSSEQVAGINSSKSINAECNRRKDGRYAILFTLILPQQEDVFITMCSDMIRYSSKESDEKSALKKVMHRYAAWLKLLDHKNNALLGLTAQKGLIGELLYLKERIENGMPVADALSGWVGPDGADQDFVYSDGWHEIKTTGIASSEISISSVEQLDSDPPGELVVMRVDKCAPQKSEAFTLHSLVHQLICFIRISPNAVESFILKLGTIGYIDMPEYNEQYFEFSTKHVYNVDASFPRLMRRDLPVEVTSAEYQLSIPSLYVWLK